LGQIEEHGERDTVVMIIGHKCDLVEHDPNERQVTREEAEKFAEKHGLLYHEASAKTGSNVKESFEDLIESIYERKKHEKSPEGRGTVINDLSVTQHPEEEEQSSCCS